jgi:hypothetical protein
MSPVVFVTHRPLRRRDALASHVVETLKKVLSSRVIGVLCTFVTTEESMTMFGFMFLYFAQLMPQILYHSEHSA